MHIFYNLFLTVIIGEVLYMWGVFIPLYFSMFEDLPSGSQIINTNL